MQAKIASAFILKSEGIPPTENTHTHTMKTESFTHLINAITGRAFTIEKRVNWRETEKPQSDILSETIYFVSIFLPLSKRNHGFDWKTPKTDEKMLRSFITAFCSKFKEPDPEAYNHYEKHWALMSEKEREYAYNHHAGHMLSKEKLLAQVQARFACSQIENALNLWGFYPTEYGIGIFCFWQTEFVKKAMENMREYLLGKGIETREEFSDARWVYRFRIETSKQIHASILNDFCASKRI